MRRKILLFSMFVFLEFWNIGHLSPRMMIPDNPWSTTWTSAQPVSAHRQKRLFDDTREAEKVLHYLCSKRIGQVAQLLLPTLTHAALFTLSSQKQEALSSLSEVAQSILNRLQYATKPIHQKLQLYEVHFRHISIIINRFRLWLVNVRYTGLHIY